MSRNVLDKNAPSPLSKGGTGRTDLAQQSGNSSPQADSDLEATCCLRGAGPVRTNASSPRLAGYEIIEELGRGGMGVVYRAWQHSLQRTVAVKMVLAGTFAGQQELDRFRAEAKAVARLHHPHLLSIYEIGEYQQMPFYAMEYMEGGSLSRRLNGQPIAPRVAAELVRSLALAMDYAHKNGIVHRDLKPANILLSGTDDTPLEACLAKITDFGIAKHLHDEISHTRTGDILGTPHYMAPEQATGRSAQVGPTADVYSLGAILYELLTGRAPFHGAEGAAVLIRLAHEEPERPSYFVRGLPRDLQTICLKCLEKEPGRRYSSAAALAHDLSRYLRDEPIQARPASLADRVCKWLRRRPAWAAIIGMTLALVLVGVALMAMMWRQAVEHAAEQDQLVSAWKSLLADDYLERGIHLAEKGDVRRGMHLMVRALEVAGEIERSEHQPSLLTPVIRRNLAAWSQCVSTHEMLLPHQDWVWDVAFSRDGKFVVTASKDKRLKVWDAETGQQIGAPLDHPYPIWGIALHPDGKTLFTLCGDVEGKKGELRVFSAIAPGRFALRGNPLPLADSISYLRMNSAGDCLWCTTHIEGRSTLVAFDGNGPDNGLQRLASLAGPHLSGEFSPDGAILATIVGTRQEPTRHVQIWNARTGEAIGAPLEHKGAVRTLAFHTSGNFLIVGSATDLSPDQGETSLLHVWDWSRARCVVQSQPLLGRIKAMSMAPSGQMLAVSLFEYVRRQDSADPLLVTDGYIGLWQIDGEGKMIRYGQPLRVQDTVWNMAFSPDSRLLLAGARNSGAFLWSVSNCRRVMAPIWHEGNCLKVAFRSDGRQAVTASAGGNFYAAARLWEVPTLGHMGPALPQPDKIRAAFWESDGNHAWFGSGEVLCQWDASRGVPTETIKLPGVAYWVHATDDDRRMLLDFGKKEMHEFKRGSFDYPRLPDFPAPDHWNPHHDFDRANGQFLQSWNGPCQLRMLDFNGKPRTPLIDEPDCEITARAFNPSGDIVALAQTVPGKSAFRLRLYAAHDLSFLRDFPLKSPASTLSFSPDGNTVALGGVDRQIQRLNLETGNMESPPLPHETLVRSVSYVRDNRLLVTAGEKGHVLLWDALTGKRIGPALEHHTDLVTIRVNPKGTSLLTATTGRMAMTWRLPEPVPGSLAEIRLWVEAITGMEMKDRDATVDLEMDQILDKRRQLKEMVGAPVAVR